MQRFFLLLFLFVLSAAPAWGAISGATLTTGGDSDCNTANPTNGGITASITPTANALVLACLVTEVASGTAGTVTLVGNSLTWVQVATVLSASATQRTTLLRGLGATPSAGTVVATTSADQTSCTWNIAEFTEVDTSGSNGSGAIVQSATGANNGVTTLVVTLGAFSNTANATMGCFGLGTNSVMTEGAGFTELGTQMNCCGSRALQEWKTANDTTVDVTTAGNETFTGVAAELKSAGTKKRSAPRRSSLRQWFGESLHALLSLGASPAQADFRNQMANFGADKSLDPPGCGLACNPNTRDDRYVAIAKQMGYEWIMTDPTGPSKSNKAALAGLKGLFNSNADGGGKWYNFDNPGNETAPLNPRLVDIGRGREEITTEIYNEISKTLCMTPAGPGMTYPDIYKPSTNQWKFYRYLHSYADDKVLFIPNYDAPEAVSLNIDANMRLRSRHQAQFGGRQLFHGLFFDEIGFPTKHAPYCENPINGSPPDNTAANVSRRNAGRKDFMQGLRAAMTAAINAQSPGSYGGASGNPFNYENFDPEDRSDYEGGANTLDHYYNESGGGTCKEHNDAIADGSYEAGPATGWETQNSATWGTIPVSKSHVSVRYECDLEQNYFVVHRTAGRIAHQSGWFGWYGGSKHINQSTNATQLLRAVPNWDNMLNISGANRNWNESTNVYTSSNSRIDPNITYSWHWRDRQKLFVSRHSGSPTITVPAGKTLIDIKCVDNVFLETTAANTPSCNTTAYFVKSGTTITPGASVQNDKGYVLYFGGNPVFQSILPISVEDQVDIKWTPGVAGAMLPDPPTNSDGWTVTVAAPPGGDVTKVASVNRDRISTDTFRLIFPPGTITVGTQVVKVSYSSVTGNITNSAGDAAVTFGPITAVNNLGGGAAAAVQTQTRSQLRHFDGEELITEDVKYGNENGNMFGVFYAALRARFKIANTVAAIASISFPLYYDRDDNTWLPVTNSCATSAIVFRDAPHINSATPTTEQLQLSARTYVAGEIVEIVGGEPTIALATDTDTEMEYAVQVCPDIALGDLRLRVHNAAGEALSAYSVLPTVIVVAGRHERHGLRITGGSH